MPKLPKRNWLTLSEQRNLMRQFKPRFTKFRKPMGFNKFNIMRSRSSFKKNKLTSIRNPSTVFQKSCIADRYHTRMPIDYIASLTATSSAQLPIAFQIMGNSIYIPFDVAANYSYNNITTVLTDTDIASKTGEVSVTSKQPQGYGEFVGPIYKGYKVKGSRIKVTVDESYDTAGSGTTLGDSVYFVALVPQLNNEQGLGDIITDFALCKQQPYSKWMMVQRTGDKKNTLTHYMDTAKLAGLTKKQFDDLPYVTYDTQPNENYSDQGIQQPWIWNVVITNSSGHLVYSVAGPNARIVVNVEMIYYVELGQQVAITQ